MRYCLEIYSQFRSFELNLERNLQVLYPIIISKNIVDVYILTDKKGNYSKSNEKKIIGIFRKYNCNVIWCQCWDNLTQYHKNEHTNELQYHRNCRSDAGKYKFTASLWYRRYILHNLVNKDNVKYDAYMSIRMFDLRLGLCRMSSYVRRVIEDSVMSGELLMSVDCVFVGDKKIMDRMMVLGREFRLYHGDIWGNDVFVEYLSKIDSCLCRLKVTYCSEIQAFAHIFFNNFCFRNIRWDFNNNCSVENKNALLHVRLCDKRKNYDIINKV